MSECVTLAREGAVAVVTIDNPPVNAASRDVRAGLMAAVAAVEGDGRTVAAVLICAGRTFVAGADVREFGRPPAPPLLPEVAAAIEGCATPWVAAIHGTALGGGLEIAMACRMRVALASARLGLPEVTLGLIPGAGGTVRLPRLVEAGTALTMVAGGRPVPAAEALAAGLVDAVVEDDLRGAALRLAEAGDWPAPTLARAPRAPEDRAAFDAAAARILARAGGQDAPRAAVEAVERALTLPPAEALAAERAAFLALKAGPQSAALRHLFAAERAVAKVPDLPDPRPLGRIGVVGGGRMGAGIAGACLIAGLPVTLIERDADALAAGRERVEGILEGARARGKLRGEAALAGATDFAALTDADLVIEAVFEEMDVKRAAFAAMDAAAPGAVLATNTSYLDVDAIAGAVADPARVIGLHFFAPAHVMKLLEVVIPARADPAAVATGLALGRRLGKVIVPAGVGEGFVANRVMSAYRAEADRLLEEGALPHEVDAAMRAYGFPMGVFQMQDLAGLDIAWAMRRRRGADAPPAPVSDRLCEMGRLGRGAERGFYDYRADPKGAVDPEVAALVEEVRGAPHRPIPQEEIMARLLGAMRREGRAAVAEGVAASEEAVDVALVHGFGFPRWKGGPFFAAKG